MSQSASQASAFYAQVAQGRTMWTLKDERGYPAPTRRVEWVPLLERDGAFVGVNWSGAQATGYDLKPRELVEIINKVSLRLSAAD